jgi:hypothetical protein
MSSGLLFVLMKTQVFESFAKMINSIPAEGILNAVELERQMLKDDLLYKKVSDEDVASIFSFCEFLKAVTEEDDLIPIELPPSHMAFYRKTVRRLIEAGELPVAAKEHFDRTFSSGFLKALAD